MQRFTLNARFGCTVVLALITAVASASASAQPATATQDAPAAGRTDPSAETADNIPADPFPESVTLPDGMLDGGTGWLNTSKPLSLKDLRGKIVVLDFWTYCCINCMHVLPDLKFLEEKYADQLVVIGVHSAKFDNEKDSENIRNAILRYEIRHPVINDSEMTVWNKFGVRAWPTLALIDPEGRYAGSQGGEGNRELFDKSIGRLINYHRAKGTLNEKPMTFELEAAQLAQTPLRYPGKVLADETSDRLFISDSNNNRIVVTTLDGSLVDVIGSGRIGRSDGGYDNAAFDHPQGMCLVGSTLYVADTENHSIRAVDLDEQAVSTLCGTGQQGRMRSGGGTLAETSLNSPWDLFCIDGTLYIAMAGPHQIWSHKPGTDIIQVFGGSGREDVINGPLSESAFAQPSGLAASDDGQFLYVADSEGSAIRRVPVATDGRVTTVAGTSELPRGQSLFAFGDVDGVGREARFQHPLGVAQHDGLLYVADAYNHKIRRIDLATNEVTTWLGTGEPGAGLSPAQLDEPAGLSIAHGQLFIADTNNHRICVADLSTAETRTLAIGGLASPAAALTSESNK